MSEHRNGNLVLTVEDLNNIPTKLLKPNADIEALRDVVYRGVPYETLIRSKRIVFEHPDGRVLGIKYRHGVVESLDRDTHGVVWMAYHDAHEMHEMHVMPCDGEEAAYEYLARRAMELRPDLPESWSTRDAVRNWHELTGDEYMRVEGPVRVFRD